MLSTLEGIWGAVVSVVVSSLVMANHCGHNNAADRTRPVKIPAYDNSLCDHAVFT